jgi:hypothetical protein
LKAYGLSDLSEKSKLNYSLTLDELKNESASNNKVIRLHNNNTSTQIFTHSNSNDSQNMLSTNNCSVDNDDHNYQKGNLTLKALNPKSSITPVHGGNSSKFDFINNNEPIKCNYKSILNLPKAPNSVGVNNSYRERNHCSNDSMTEIRSCIESVNFDDEDLLKYNDEVFRKLNVPKNNHTNTLKLDMIDLKFS